MSKKTLNRRDFLRLSTLAAAGVLASCSSPKPIDKLTTPLASPTITLRCLLGEQGEELTLYRKMMQNFTETVDPNITVLIESQPGALAVKLQTLIAAGMAPDIFRVNLTDFTSYAARGALEMLDPFTQRQTDWSPEDIPPGVREAFMFDGHLWSVPDAPVSRGLFYNKTLFDEARISYPDNTWTWETMSEAAKALTQRSDDRTEQYGLMFGTRTVRLETIIVQNGGNLIDEKLTRCLLHEPAAYEAVQWFADLLVKHKVSPLPTDDRSGFTFPSGKVAMSHNEGSWMTSEFVQIRKDNPEFNWDYALLPYGPAGVNTLVLNAGGFGIATQSKFKEETWKFLNYMTRGGSEYLAKFGDGAYLPTRYSSLEKPDLYYHENAGYNQKAVVDGITQSIPPRLKHPNESEIWRAISTSLAPVWLGSRSAKEACIEAADMVDFLLAG